MEISTNYLVMSKNTVKTPFTRRSLCWCKPRSRFRVEVSVDTSRPAWLLIWRAALIVTIAISGCQPAGLIHDGVIDEQDLDRIVHNVQRAATIQYLRPVKAKVVTLTMARKFLEDSQIDEFGGKENVRALSQINVDLGLVVLPEHCNCDPKDALSFLTYSLASVLGAYEDSPDWVSVIEGVTNVLGY